MQNEPLLKKDFSDMIKNKKASGRHRDLAVLEKMVRIQGSFEQKSKAEMPPMATQANPA